MTIPSSCGTSVQGSLPWGTLRNPNGHEAYSAAFDRDGGRIVTAGGIENVAYIWDSKTVKEPSVLRGHTTRVLTAAFSPNGKFVVTAGGQTARVWNAGTGNELVNFREDIDEVTSAVFSPDGKYILTASKGSHGGTMRIYDFEAGGSLKDLMALADGRVTREFTAEERAKFCPAQSRVWTLQWHERQLKYHRSRWRGHPLRNDLNWQPFGVLWDGIHAPW
jgi:WD40 repeat protein